MKILVLGADGMIGHKIAQILINHQYDIILNSRSRSAFLKKTFPSAQVIGFDLSFIKIKELLNNLNPELIINAVGITIRRGAEYDQTTNYINSILPHEIDLWCQENKKKLIHFSTDCVFSGKTGNYSDNDLPDAEDSYGKSKRLGEVNSSSTLTIRTSMIGRELFNKTELLEWVISNKNKKVNGFDMAIYSGVTTLWMSKTVFKIINQFPNLNGIWNISSNPISKFNLIKKINHKFKLNLDINKDSSFCSNKSLNSNRFFSETKYEIPNWDDMLAELFIDSNENSNLYIK